MKEKFLFLLFIIFSAKGFSQCCSPGNPVGGDANQGVLNQNSIKVMGIFINSISNDYYEGSRKSTDTLVFVDRGIFSFSGITLAAGLFKRFTLESELGYFISKKQEFLTPSKGRQELIGSGLSDLAFIGKFKIFSLPENQLEITGGAGYKFPVGTHEQRNENGILLPIDIQPSSGAHGYIGTLFLYKGFSERKMRFFLTSRFHITPDDVVFSEGYWRKKYYRYGNFYTASLFGNYSLSHRWNFILQGRAELRSKDIFKFEGDTGYRIYESSGGHKIFAIPQVLFEIRQGFNVSAMLDIPVYQYYNQKQLATSYAGSIFLSKVFDCHRPEKKQAGNENREN